MLRRVVHRSRPITSQISASGVFAATSSANRSFSATVNGLCISHLPDRSNPIRTTDALTH
jgi:hypothetical protein